MNSTQHDAVIIGGGLAGIVCALELLRAGKQVALIDRDTPERLGGLALWAFYVATSLPPEVPGAAEPPPPP